MKKIINQPTAVVDEMLDGLAYIHSDLVHRVEGFDIIARNSEKSGKVAIISGGGSGHEPLMLALWATVCCQLRFAERSLLPQLLTKSCRQSKKQTKAQVCSWLSRIILATS